MDPFSKYLEKYEELEASMGGDTPPACRVGGILLGTYLVTCGAICATSAPHLWAIGVVTAVFVPLFLLIRHDAKGKGIRKRTGNRPREP